jgi:hypothetical protein
VDSLVFAAFLMEEDMPNRILTAEESKTLFAPLLRDVREKLKSLSSGEEKLLFALRRKLYKDLSYDERGTPMRRRVVKAAKYSEQLGRCAICSEPLESLGKNAVLNRKEAMDGSVPENVRLICSRCHRNEQKARNYS